MINTASDIKIYCKLINHETICSFKTNLINSSHAISYHHTVKKKKAGIITTPYLGKSRKFLPYF